MSIIIINNQSFKNKENLIEKHFDLITQDDGFEYFSCKDTDDFIEDCFCVRFDSKQKVSCVYMIGGFYIGKTIDLRSRLVSHTANCLKGRHNNLGFQDKIIKNLTNGVKCPLSILDFDTSRERAIIEHYCNYYTLCNIQYNLNL